MVIKADGLCDGKGVVVANTKETALEAAYNILIKKVCGDGGSSIVIEDKLDGPECSVMAFCDGENAALPPASRDYKRAENGDRGAHTGGMGAYSPLPDVDEVLLAQLKRQFILPILRVMAQLRTPFTGLAYLGLMLTRDGPMLLEWNVRFGDPEVQVALPRIENDIVPYTLGTLKPGGLSKLLPLTFLSRTAVCVNLVSEG
jgi:phosphoribosylamine--glycine ligase